MGILVKQSGELILNIDVNFVFGPDIIVDHFRNNIGFPNAENKKIESQETEILLR